MVAPLQYPAAHRAVYTTLAMSRTDPHNPSPIVKHLIHSIFSPNSPILASSACQKSPNVPNTASSNLPYPELIFLTYIMKETAKIRSISRYLDSIKGLEQPSFTTSQKGLYPIIWLRTAA
ncbi:uncharacterized protein RAG0_10482 [Rhynchosporium agropyri]|uniref:Uncharacterized protein n=1 Tax=Rhynchosporium agropyri TaxID=914238 RepID=A0A1E1L008_9HELO|nr:uncharacterized protein RAG0_10482 [Rhynchosporium agropyri]